MVNFQELKNNIKGNIITPYDKEYEAASTTFAAKGAPAVIVRPLTAQDVAQAIAFSRAQNLVLSVRSGGHSGAGHSTNNGGLVIDLTRMNTVKVIDKAKHIVRIGGGALWGDVAKTLDKHGLAISSGDTTTVGVGGLTLAGGIGWMVRKYGLAIDNLVAAEVVTADGSVLRTSADEHSDLFWAIRGGGGNFGVVTSFDFAAQPMGKVYTGTVMYELKDLERLLKKWRDYMRAAPEELTTVLAVMPGSPAGPPPFVMIMLCFAGGDEATAMQAIEPFLNLGTVKSKDIKRQEYAAALHEVPAPSTRIIANNAFVKELSDELIGVVSCTSGQMLQIRSLGGAMNRVTPDATAFAHRNSEALVVAATFIPPDADDSAADKVTASWRNIARFADGAYAGLLSENTGEEVKAAYPPATYERLAAIKKQYDPQNIFSRNYNIPPKP